MNAWTTAGPPTASAGVEKPLQSANISGWTDGAVPRTGCPGTSSGVLDRRFPQAESDSHSSFVTLLALVSRVVQIGAHLSAISLLPALHCVTYLSELRYLLPSVI